MYNYFKAEQNGLRLTSPVRSTKYNSAPARAALRINYSDVPSWNLWTHAAACRPDGSVILYELMLPNLTAKSQGELGKGSRKKGGSLNSSKHLPFSSLEKDPPPEREKCLTVRRVMGGHSSGGVPSPVPALSINVVTFVWNWWHKDQRGGGEGRKVLWASYRAGLGVGGAQHDAERTHSAGGAAAAVLVLGI